MAEHDAYRKRGIDENATSGNCDDNLFAAILVCVSIPCSTNPSSLKMGSLVIKVMHCPR